MITIIIRNNKFIRSILWKNVKVELEKLLKIKESRARDLIIYLLENNFISKIGKYKSTKYIKNQS